MLSARSGFRRLWVAAAFGPGERAGLAAERASVWSSGRVGSVKISQGMRWWHGSGWLSVGKIRTNFRMAFEPTLVRCQLCQCLMSVIRNINSETNCKCVQGTANARKGVIDYRQQALRQGGHVS